MIYCAATEWRFCAQQIITLSRTPCVTLQFGKRAFPRRAEVKVIRNVNVFPYSLSHLAQIIVQAMKIDVISTENISDEAVISSHLERNPEARNCAALSAF